VKARIIAFGSVLAGILLWHGLALRVGPLLLPSPLGVLQACATHGGDLLAATGQTAGAALLGLGLALACGVGLGAVTWASPSLRAASAPWTVGLQVLPIVAVAPLLVTWLGYGTPVAMLTGALAAFYPAFAATRTGLEAPQPEWVDLLRLLGASRLQELWRLRLPAALPAMFAGVRASAGLSVIGAIVGEFVGSNGDPPTLGFLVVSGARAARLDLSFAAVICAALLALALHGAIRLLERRAIGAWYGA
jgi:NitT/TauT family transport system permease protein